MSGFDVQQIKQDSDCFRKIDLFMHEAFIARHIPGMAVGIVMDGKVVFKKGYGMRAFSGGAPVTENTLFAVGSCTKAFTAFALGQLVDKGLIRWDDPASKHIPEFRLHDSHATNHVTIRDLVAHRSGLPRHDFVWYGAECSRGELLKRVQYLEPSCDIRERFQYNNLMYAIAGVVVERVTGQSWEEYVDRSIFKPLGMANSNFSVEKSMQSEDFAWPHTRVNGVIETTPFKNLSSIGPAGSINSSLNNMLNWVQTHLSEGEFLGASLIRSDTLKEMHKVHMPIHGQPIEELFGFGYGLGWFTSFHKGSYVVAHGGGIDGFISEIALFKEEGIGVVILTNSDEHFLFPRASAFRIADILTGKGGDQCLSKFEDKEKQIMGALAKTGSGIQEKNGLKEADGFRFIEKYIGEFEHSGYGTIMIFLKEGALAASHHKALYHLHFTEGESFIMKAEKRELVQFNGFFRVGETGGDPELHLSLEPAVQPIVFKRI